MIKIRVVFLFLLFVGLSTGTQASNNDSLVGVFKNPAANTYDRLKSLQVIDWAQYSKTSEGIDLMLEGIELAEKSEQDSFITYFLYHKAYLHNRLGEYDQAIKDGKKALTTARNQGSRKMVLYAYLDLAEAWKNLEKWDSCQANVDRLETDEMAGSPKQRTYFVNMINGGINLGQHRYQRALDYFLRIEEREERRVVIGFIAICYQDLGLHDSAIIWHRKAIRIGKRLNDGRGLANTYYNLAACYGTMERLDSCAEYAFKALHLFREYEQYLGYSLSCALIADLYSEQGEYAKAESLLKEVTTVLLEKHQSIHATNLIVAQARNYKTMGDLKSAKSALDKALSMVESGTEHFRTIHSVYGDILLETNPEEAKSHYLISRVGLRDDKDLTIIQKTGLSLAKIYLELEQSDSAILELNALDFGSLTNSQKVRFYELRGWYFEKTDQLDSAYFQAVLAKQYTDSLYLEKDQGAMKEVLAKFSVELAEQKQKLAESEARNERRQKIFGFVLLGLAVVSIFLIILNHRRYRREKEESSRLKIESIQQKMTHARDILENQSRLILEKNRIISELNKDVELLAGEALDGQKNLEAFVESRILTKEDWERFKKYFDAVFPGFFTTMEDRYPKITEGELRLLCLIKLGMSNSEIADMLGVLPLSVKRTKTRFKVKYNIESGAVLSEILNL